MSSASRANNQADRLRVLSLQAFYGGSHRDFMDGWIKHSGHSWEQLNLPARHWKWRMRHSAIWFAQQIAQRWGSAFPFDVVVATDMTNLAELRGLLAGKRIGESSQRWVLYMHENQFAYPSRFPIESAERTRDMHFAFTNLVSTAAADAVWFNSGFNRDSMLQGCAGESARWPDFVPQSTIDGLADQATIVHPGIELPDLDLKQIRQQRIERASRGEPIRLVWAARWEHDKGPDELLQTLLELDQQSIDFRISVLGQCYRKIPAPFTEIHERFAERIDHWGFLESKQEYFRVLAEADLFLSTANHEFFGLAAAEAIAMGLCPLLPDRLAYPELISLLVDSVGDSTAQEKYLYQKQPWQAILRLDRQRNESPQAWQVPLEQVRTFRRRIDWRTRAGELDHFLVDQVPTDRSR